MKNTKKIIAGIMVFAVSFSGSFINTYAAKQYNININLIVNGEDMGAIAAFDNDYENNLYVSLKSIAYALSDTGKCFSVDVEKGSIAITTGVQFADAQSTWDDDELSKTGNPSLRKNDLVVDELPRKYYSFIINKNGGLDAFLAPVCIGMILDVDIKVTDENISIDTTKPFAVSAEEMETAGYLQGVNSLVIGDGTTGEMYYKYDSDEVVAIASTTKLMSYLVIMDAVKNGEASLSDTVQISGKAAKMSTGSDGVIPMKAGTSTPMKELLYGMLLPSSNECAIAIAEHIAGSEEAFVERMQNKAAELGLENTEFYNCHGLPVYEDQLIPAKMQNHMTANEMFVLASAIMSDYPETAEITSTQKYHMQTFNQDIENTNQVIFNIDDAVGLKTGTTNKAGACLVTCSTVKKDGSSHNLITVLMGAENDVDRGVVSEISARYAIDRFLNEDAVFERQKEYKNIPDNPEDVVREILKQAAF